MRYWDFLDITNLTLKINLNLRVKIWYKIVYIYVKIDFEVVCFCFDIIRNWGIPVLTLNNNVVICEVPHLLTVSLTVYHCRDSAMVRTYNHPVPRRTFVATWPGVNIKVRIEALLSLFTHFKINTHAII